MIVCMRAEGYSLKRSLSITLSAVVGTRVGMITFDAPVFTSTSPYNIMLSGTGSLTLAGFYFGYEDATPTSMRVMWESASEGTATLEWGPDESLGNTEVSEGVTSPGGAMHDVLLDGLSPSSACYYRVASG